MPAFNPDGTEIPAPKAEDLTVMCELGGQFDRCQISVSFIHADLDRGEISQALGISPKFAWNAGEPHVPPLSNGQDGRYRVLNYGRWFASIEVVDEPVAEALRRLLTTCPATPGTWTALAAKWSGRIALVGKTESWNREFHVPVDVLSLLVERGLPLMLDAYFYGFESGSEEA